MVLRLHLEQVKSSTIQKRKIANILVSFFCFCGSSLKMTSCCLASRSQFALNLFNLVKFMRMWEREQKITEFHFYLVLSKPLSYCFSRAFFPVFDRIFINIFPGTSISLCCWASRGSYCICVKLVIVWYSNHASTNRLHPDGSEITFKLNIYKIPT